MDAAFWLTQPSELIHHQPPQDEASQYTSDGTVDTDNEPALKQTTGNWRACFFILGTVENITMIIKIIFYGPHFPSLIKSNLFIYLLILEHKLSVEFSECLAYFGVAMNLITYLTIMFHESNMDAARSVSTWMGNCYFTPFIGAFLVETFWGRYWTIIIFLSIYIIGMVILTVSASLPLHLHFSYNSGVHCVAVYLGLYLVTLGTGGINPCTSALEADQFNVADLLERVNNCSFNWYYFLINIGSLLSATVLAWVQDDIGWPVGFANPVIRMSLGFTMSVAGRRVYRYKKPEESPTKRFSQVIVASCKKSPSEVA